MTIPDGWVLVPIEPTDEMLIAYGRALKTLIESTDPDVRGRFFAELGPSGGSKVPNRAKARIRWRAMIAAAPQPAPEDVHRVEGQLVPVSAKRLAKAIMELNRAWLACGHHAVSHGGEGG